MIIITSKCGGLGHGEFILEADESAVPDLYLRELAETVEHLVAEGSNERDSGWFAGCLADGHDHNDPGNSPLPESMNTSTCWPT